MHFAPVLQKNESNYLNAVRKRNVVLLVVAVLLVTAAAAQRPRCPQCDRVLEAHGQETRQVVTTYEQTISLRRSYATCPSCGTGLFPPG